MLSQYFALPLERFLIAGRIIRCFRIVSILGIPTLGYVGVRWKCWGPKNNKYFRKIQSVGQTSSTRQKRNPRRRKTLSRVRRIFSVWGKTFRAIFDVPILGSIGGDWDWRGAINSKRPRVMRRSGNYFVAGKT